jgi:hypothetical protein
MGDSQYGSKFEVPTGAMSKNNNVNPGQYKVAGRERQGEEVVHDREKAKASVTEHDEREQAKRRKKTGGATVNKKR